MPPEIPCQFRHHPAEKAGSLLEPGRRRHLICSHEAHVSQPFPLCNVVDVVQVYERIDAARVTKQMHVMIAWIPASFRQIHGTPQDQREGGAVACRECHALAHRSILEALHGGHFVGTGRQENAVETRRGEVEAETVLR